MSPSIHILAKTRPLKRPNYKYDFLTLHIYSVTFRNEFFLKILIRFYRFLEKVDEPHDFCKIKPLQNWNFIFALELLFGNNIKLIISKTQKGDFSRVFWKPQIYSNRLIIYWKKINVTRYIPYDIYSCSQYSSVMVKFVIIYLNFWF